MPKQKVVSIEAATKQAVRCWNCKRIIPLPPESFRRFLSRQSVIRCPHRDCKKYLVRQ